MAADAWSRGSRRFQHPACRSAGRTGPTIRRRARTPREQAQPSPSPVPPRVRDLPALACQPGPAVWPGGGWCTSYAGPCPQSQHAPHTNMHRRLSTSTPVFPGCVCSKQDDTADSRPTADSKNSKQQTTNAQTCTNLAQRYAPPCVRSGPTSQRADGMPFMHLRHTHTLDLNAMTGRKQRKRETYHTGANTGWLRASRPASL